MSTVADYWIEEWQVDYYWFGGRKRCWCGLSGVAMFLSFWLVCMESNTCTWIPHAISLWSKTAKNTDWSTRPLTRPFARSLAPLVHLLRTARFARALHCAHLLARSLTSLTRLLVGNWIFWWLFILCFFLFWPTVNCQKFFTSRRKWRGEKERKKDKGKRRKRKNMGKKGEKEKRKGKERTWGKRKGENEKGRKEKGRKERKKGKEGKCSRK